MVKDSLGNQTCEHGPLSEEDGTERIGAPAQKGKTPRVIGVSRNQPEVQSGEMPKEAKPDEEPHVPTQQNELENGYADKHIPETGSGQVKASSALRIP